MSDCIESARTPSRPYPQMKVDGRMRPESNVVWERANGPIPDGFIICHTCDNTRCVRLEHLWLGTHGDNARDREAKGRGRGGWADCPQGHALAGDNLYRSPDGRRQCRQCRKAADRRRRGKTADAA